MAAPIGTSARWPWLRYRQRSIALSIGCPGNYAAPPANQIVHEADLVLFVGCHTGDQVTHTWRIPPLDTQVVQIDIDPLESGRSYRNTLGLMGDPKATLAKLNAAIGRPARDTGFADRAAGIVAAWREARAPRLASNAAPILPDRLCAEITRALPEDGILVADTGYSVFWTSTLIELNGTAQTYLRAAGSLGWSFPASLGAKCAAGRRKVICWSGDGAIYYHLTELETARRRGIAVVLVINNNSGFGQGWPNMQRQQGNRPGDVSELGRFGPTNFADVARVFGLRGIRVEEPSAIGPALRDALASDETVVVDVNTDIDARAPEPWLPPGAHDAMPLIFHERVGLDGRRISPFSWRIRYALAHKQIDPDVVPTRFADVARIRTLSGQDLVPIIEHDGEVVHDSWSIACHLEDCFPDRPSLFGGAAGRGAARLVNFWSDGVLGHAHATADLR